jgi:putative ABC transport system permease protein
MNWWKRLSRRTQMEAQLEKELSFHLEQHTSQLIGHGIPPDEARRQARLALGGPEQVKEKCRDARGTRWLEDLLQDTRYALRTFRRKPGFTVIALLILSLGIGATTVMFAVINSVLLRPLSYPEPDRLVTLRGFTEAFGELWGCSNLDFGDVKRESQTLALAAWTYGGGTISEPGEPEYVNGRQISAELFSTLGISPLQGRAFRLDEDRPGAAAVAIISYGLWQRDFGGQPSTIGRSLVYDGKTYTVVGIAPAGLQLDGGADVFTPLEQRQNTDPRMQNRAARFLRVMARLRPGFGLAEARAELALIARHLAEEYPKSNAGLSMIPYPLQKELVGDVGSTLWLLLCAVGLVLLIACVNIASLLLARAVSRERELAIRVALGAGRGRLARQCLTESAILGVGGGLLGVVLAFVSIHPFVAFWPGSLPRAEEVHLDWRVLVFAVGASLLSGFFFGLAPALRVPMRGVEQTLRAGARSIAGSSRHLHSAFVISEIALAVVLLVSAGMLGHTLLALSSIDPGFNVHNVMAAHFALSPSTLANPEKVREAWQDVLDRARRVPGVESVALADIIPMRKGENSVPYWTTATPPPPNQEPVALASCVTPDYLKVMGIPLRHGRFFNEHDRIGSEPVVVVDENLAQHAFGSKDAVGKRIWIPAMGATPALVVGIVGHVRQWGLAADDQSRVRDQMYYPFAQVPAPLLHFFSSIMSFAARTTIPPLNVVGPLRQELRGVAGDQALYEVHTMEQLVSASLARQRFLLLLFGIFAGLALLLACIGIYGVLAYLTGQRVPEIGVRMTLGAKPLDVMRLVLGESLVMICVGVGVGILAALAAGRILNRLVEGMRPADVSTFAITIPVLVLAALFASFVPARRASRVDPVSALRQQ